MSRDSVVFVTLRDRTNFANKQRADLFVSVHANAHPQTVSEGVETYFLSSEASDSGARQVAAMPAILIEIGFLTNRKEERKLATPEHREALARAIYAGLAEYKRRYDQRLRTAQSQPAKGGP